MDEIKINETSTPQETSGLLLLQDGQLYLLEIGKWARFLGIMGFIGSALVAVVGLFFGTLMTVLTRYQATPMPKFFGGAMGFVYVLIGVLYFFIALYLYQFGIRIKTAIQSADSFEVSLALSKLKSFFKTIGILTIAMLILYAFLIVIFIVIAVATAGITART